MGGKQEEGRDQRSQEEEEGMVAECCWLWKIKLGESYSLWYMNAVELKKAF